MTRYPLLFAILMIGWLPGSLRADTDALARSILTTNCKKCHGPDKQKGGLRLDSREGATAPGDSGMAAIVPGMAGSSELIARVTSKDAKLRMPPGDTPLTTDQIQTLRKWIDAGAVWPADGAVTPKTAKSELIVTDEDRQHWSYRPLRTIPIPAGSAHLTPVDAFHRAALKARNLTPTNSADRRTLIRRLTFDLTGLPPTPEEVSSFTTSNNPESAYAALVDRLLASPHYGERWGRHWLDVARYADSGGYEGDHDRPNAYHYRDFIIRALNDDMPFDEFVRRQLAGDEIAPDDPHAIAATGFLAVGPAEMLPPTLLEEELTRQRYTELDDMVTTTGAAFLGLTVGCARCHDHKFDPIPTRDYYRLTAALHSGNRAVVPLGTRAEVERHAKERAAWDKQRKAAEDEFNKWKDGQRANLRSARIDALSIPVTEKTLLRDKPESKEAKALAKKHEKALAISDDDVQQGTDDAARQRGNDLAAALAAVKAKEPKALPAALAFKDFGGKPVASWLFRRGDFHDKTIPVELGFLTVVSNGKPPAEYWAEARASGDRTDTTYQRRALAAWMTDTRHGAGALLARVIVNRIWQFHFGEGLVRTPNDFGIRGDRPTHPELLEWLANDLVANGWKLKRLHRLILLSAAYRQGTTYDPEKAKIDPDNKLLWRMRPKRLEAESLRDSLLAVGGTLNLEMYGPAVKAPIPADAMVARNLKNPYPKDVADSPAVRRRAVYLFHKRVIPNPLLQAFDAPDAQQCTGRRANTTVVPQALALLNDPFVRARAADFAVRLEKEANDVPVDRAYQLAFGRAPTDAETKAGNEFLAAQVRDRSERQPDMDAKEIRRLALTDYCQAIFGLNEFLYVD